MKIYVAITDNYCYRYLAEKRGLNDKIIVINEICFLILAYSQLGGNNVNINILSILP
jgi:hypothetical protein